MKNDVKKIETITGEMVINDLVYRLMQYEYDKLIHDIDYGEYDDIETVMKKAYFSKRILSVLADKDLPIRIAIGLFFTGKVLEKLYENRYDFIGDSDTDEDIYEYLIEYGCRMYEPIAHISKTPEEVFMVLTRLVLFGCEDDEEDEDDDDDE